MLTRQLTFEKQSVQIDDSRPPIKTEFKYSEEAY